MIYFADLHIHSRFSRATSRDCNLGELARWAALKGLLVLATGDFTHPQWAHEIREMLEEAEDGLFRLKKEYVPQFEPLPGGGGPGDVRFMLNVEISSIYKKNGATRKVHSLVFMPDIDSMSRFNARLERIGNLKSDGRPILGLDARHLLEIALETNPESFLVPAHVWTPWFSVLGSRSGFDSVEECFDDLTPMVFALETGLSSDPEMNRRVASLDGYTLISNSDTHSPANLGREANIFFGPLGYRAIREGIRSGGSGDQVERGAASPRESVASLPESVGTERAVFLGTVEFFPEEGKYHLDGHRKCSARLEPRETERLKGRCPICGQPVTVGVMNRVTELADRKAGTQTVKSAPFWRMVPLAEIVAQAMGVGAQSKKVKSLYMDLLNKLGPELEILWGLPLVEISRRAPDIIVEAIARVRRGDVSIQAGYDGEYGSVQLFTQSERDLFSGQASFVQVETVTPRPTARQNRATIKRDKKRKQDAPPGSPSKSDGHLNEEQEEAVSISQGPVVVKAGPGTGKTRTLTRRIVSLIERGVAQGREITAVTFTRKAAQEMQDRLRILTYSDDVQQCWVGTFHQLGARIIERFRQKGVSEGRERVLDRKESLSVFRSAAKDLGLHCPPGSVLSLYDRVGRLKQDLIQETLVTDNDLARAYDAYEDHLKRAGALDLDDLLIHAVRLLRGDSVETRRIRDTFARHLCIDEFQDVNRVQYEMVRLLSGQEGRRLFVIGDPDQAIYGFRGADWRYFDQLKEDYPSAKEVFLTRNYRSRPAILKAAHCVLDRSCMARLQCERDEGGPVQVASLGHSTSEGHFITRTIDSMVGGASFLSVDSQMEGASVGKSMGFEDFAVLYRLNAVGDALEESFRASGIPFQRIRRENPEEEAEARDPRARAVSLMTIHAAKGLEFPVVFIAGCEDGIIPYSGTDDAERTPPDPEEERRLLYVAMTRAQDHLFLTSSSRRVLFGRTVRSRPAPFLRLVDKSLCVSVDTGSNRNVDWAPGPVQGELFHI